ncbi:MAG: hypothetical protein ACRC7N_11775 [Clostridium sp.]
MSKSIDEMVLDNESGIKTIRFADHELILLKFIKFKNRDFSGYVKELIHKEYDAFIEKRDNYVSKEELRSIVIEVLDELN